MVTYILALESKRYPFKRDRKNNLYTFVDLDLYTAMLVREIIGKITFDDK